ncbi:MAG: hypothetical protein ILA17_08520, partial [Ruminococcus sp.]|nr:hypothetical protein [Ruminococcus sp.]
CGVLLKVLSSNLASKSSPLFRYLGQRPKWRKRDKSFRGGVWGETLFQKGPPQLRGVHTAANTDLQITTAAVLAKRTAVKLHISLL